MGGAGFAGKAAHVFWDSVLFCFSYRGWDPGFGHARLALCPGDRLQPYSHLCGFDFEVPDPGMCLQVLLADGGCVCVGQAEEHSV